MVTMKNRKLIIIVIFEDLCFLESNVRSNVFITKFSGTYSPIIFQKTIALNKISHHVVPTRLSKQQQSRYFQSHHQEQKLQTQPSLGYIFCQ